MNYEQYVGRVEEARGAAKAYYAGEPVMSDASFDHMVDEIVAWEQAHPEQVDPSSPTQVVGTPASEHATRHVVLMLSLNKFTTPDEVKRFLATMPRTTQYLLSKKLDGVSMSLTYVKGKLVLAMTRGDGTLGEDVTDRVALLPSVPNSLPTDFTGILRGEIVIWNEKLSGRFKNARNAVAGVLGSSTITAARDEHAHFYAFDVVGSEDPIVQARALGFDTAPSAILPAAQVQQGIEEMFALATPYLCDGVVVKVVGEELKQKLGNRSNSPRYAFAYKVAGETAQARITGLKTQVGKSGTIGLVYTIEPTDLGGTTISNLTAHNFSEIRRKDVRKGDIVTIIRRGEVIPAVEHVTNPAQRDGSEVEFEIPTLCPGCDSPLEVFGNSMQIRCTGSDCRPQLVRRLVHWASKKAGDIDAISTVWVEKFVETSLVTDVVDFYRITRLDLMRFENMGEGRAGKFLDSIEQSKGLGMRRALVGLAIPQAGEGSSQRLAKEFASVEEVMRASVTQLASVPDIGLVQASSIYDFFQSSAVQGLILDLRACGVNLDRLPEDAPLTLSEAQGSFANTVCVITGALTVERDVFKQLLEQQGATVTGSVSKRSTYLIIGSNVGAAKTNKAKEVGTIVLTEQVAREMMGL